MRNLKQTTTLTSQKTNQEVISAEVLRKLPYR
jgi:hypothetical protein